MLHGGYVFDDFANIVENTPLHIQSLSWASLHQAAMSSPSRLLLRPLAMLSFGLNYYFFGSNPFSMKLVNLGIHLLNGLLLFVLLRRIIRYALSENDPANTDTSRADLLAVCISAAWLLAPINFTAVAYVVQRMESLCQVFVLAGLWGYVASRQRMLAGESRMFWCAALSIVLGTLLGVSAKESALLLPLYAVLVEWALFGFTQPNGKYDKRLFALYVIVLVLPGCLAGVWAYRHVLPAAAWDARTFTLAQRLLTEPRILIDYIHWSLLPTANDLALYHDNIKLSHGLLHPVTTLLSVLCLLVLAGSAFLLKNKRPLAALGIAWFLSAHLLTGTIVPLELVFEHRNYFASIGLYLLVFQLLLPSRHATLVLARTTACVAMLVLFAAITYIRAVDWSNPLSFAISEVQKNPESPRTAYELGRVLVVMSDYDPKSPFVPKAYAALDHAATLPEADILPDQAIVMLSSRLHRPVPERIWRRMQQRLANQPLSAQNIAALYSLSQCAIRGDCDLSKADMVACFVAALKHEPPNTRVLSIYANYAFNVLHDSTLAINLAKIAIRQDAGDLQLRRNLILLLQNSGQHAEAENAYQETLKEIPSAKDDSNFDGWSHKVLAAPQTAPAAQRSMP